MNATQLYRVLCTTPYPGTTITLDGIGCNVRVRATNLHLVYDIDGWKDADGRLIDHNLPHPGEATAQQVHAELRRVIDLMEQDRSIELTEAQAAALTPLVRANRAALGLPTPKQQDMAVSSKPEEHTYVALVALNGTGVWSVGEGVADARMRAADHWRRAVNAPKLSEMEWLATLRAVNLSGDLCAVKALVSALGDVDPFVPVELRGDEP